MHESSGGSFWEMEIIYLQIITFVLQIDRVFFLKKKLTLTPRAIYSQIVLKKNSFEDWEV